MSTKIVGFQSEHDASYCILEDGIPIIHEEMERMTRRKMEQADGLKFFFERQTDFSDIKYFTFGNWGFRSGEYEKDYFTKEADDKMREIVANNEGAYFEFGHHISHAANVFYTSSFDKALVITIDGGGWEPGHFPTALAISEGLGNKLTRIKVFEQAKVNLGRMYSKTVQYVYRLPIGFPDGDESGTVMAMATMGEAKYTHLYPDLNHNWYKLRRITNLSEQEGFNVAASLQQYFEETFYNLVAKYINESGHVNLCFSGGVSLNCVMMGKIRKWFPKIKNIFCDPVPYDGGLSLGSARYLWHHVLGNPRIKDHIRNQSPYLGKIYSRKAVLDACGLFSDKIIIERASGEDILKKINRQKIVAVFGGGSESGRRALGNRSILADPRNPQMKKIVNEKVKHRQWFRPVAPAILEERVDEWFEDPLPSPYMSFALKFKKEKKDKVPAVVHFDGTGRLQTVNKLLSPWFHDFITKWEKLSGVPILINTSFNDSEPIVETPVDAFKCFLKTQINYLYFFDYGILVSKLK